MKHATAPSAVLPQLVTKAQLRRANGDCSDRTIDRRVKSGEFPPPVYINGRPYWHAEPMAAILRAGTGRKRSGFTTRTQRANGSEGAR